MRPFMAGFQHAPASLVVFGITCTALAGVVILVLLWHAIRRALDIPRVPRGPGTYVVMVLATAGLLAAGVGAFVVAAGLDDWPPPGRAPLAEVRCHKLTPTTARLSFVPLALDGARGPEEVESVARSCDLGFQRLRFAAPLARFGLIERLRLARVGNRLRPAGTPAWRALPQPLGAPVAVASDEQLPVPPEDDRPYRVLADDRGFRLEKVER
jgi:hypothetical protein